MNIVKKHLPTIIFLLATVFISLFPQPIYAEDGEVIKARVEEIEIKEDSEQSLSAKIKVQLLGGTYAGTSLYTDYESNVKLRVGDEIYVSQTISDNELQKVDYIGFDRTMYLVWLLIAASIILISIIAIKNPKELIPIVLLGTIVIWGVFNKTFSITDHYLGSILIISGIIIITNIIQKGIGILNIIATVGGIAGITITLILQIFFSNAMRIPIINRSLFDVGVVIAATGMIFYNAQKIVFELKDTLRLQEVTNRSQILREGLEISRKYSSFAVVALFWAFIGLTFPTIYLKLEEGVNGIGFFNDPEIAQITSAILSSIIGLLIVPITTTVLSFFIIDINNLGRRVPKKKQMEMNV